MEWMEPTDRSPVLSPEGWTHGGLEGIGGGQQARVWYGPDDHRVIYEPFDTRVALQRWNGREYELVENEMAHSLTDRAMAKAARHLMESYSSGALGGFGGWL